MRAIKDFMKETLDMAINAGASECDLILGKGKSLKLSSQQQKLEEYNVSSSQILGIRAIKDNRVGISYSESMQEDAIVLMIKNSLENAKNSNENPHEKIELTNVDDIVENDDKYNIVDKVETQEKIDLALKLESTVLDRDNRVESCPYNGLSESESEYYYLNSPGTFCVHTERVVGCYTSALISEGSDKAIHYHSEKSRSFDSLNWMKCVDESLKHAAYWLKGRPLDTGKYDVVFTANVLSDIFSCYSNIFSGKASKDKRNPLFEKLGTEIFNSDLSIIDAPSYEKAFYYSSFDDEGNSRMDLNLIENGVYKNIMHNSVTAKYFNTNNTFHAARSPRGGLGVTATNTLILPREASDADIFNGTVFEIHSVQGIGSGTDAISGDFSMAASGYLLRNGEIGQPVKGVTIAGNFFEMLKNIEIIGNKIEEADSMSFYTPIIRFSSLSVAGK